jgi:hypothetical protein
MSGTSERASIRLGTEDIDGARAKLENLGTVGDAALRKIATAGQSAANAFAGIAMPGGADAMRDRAADVAAYGLELDRLRARFDPVFAASRRYEAGLEEIAEAERVGAINARIAADARDRLTAAYQASHAPVVTAAAGMATLGRTSEAAAYQQKQLAFQLNDVFTSLTTGAPPLQVFLQQGGQITQIYGGVGATVRAAAAAIGGPLVLGAAAAAVGVGVLVARSASLAQEQRTLEVALRGTGRQAEISASQLAGYARELEKQGVARTDARGIAGDLARTQGLTAANAGRVAALAPDLGAALGIDAAAAAKQLSEAFTGGYQAVTKLDDALNLLDRDQKRAVRTMFEHGESTKATALVAEQLTLRLAGLNRDALGPTGLALRDLANGWSAFMDAVATSTPILRILQETGAAVQAMRAAVSGQPIDPATLPPDDARRGWLSPEARALMGSGPPTPDMQAADMQRQLDAARRGLQVFGPQSGYADRVRQLEGQLAALRQPPAPGVGAPDLAPPAAAEGAGQLAVVGAGTPSERERLRQLARVDALTLSAEQQARVLAAAPPQRVRVQAEISAENEARDRGITNPEAAAELKRRRVAEAIAKEADARGQNVAAITREGQAALMVAAAAGQGEAAMIRARAAAEAHAQAATEAGVNETALAAAIVNRGAAQEAQKAGETAVALGAQNAALERLIAAEGQGSRAAYYAAIDEKVREATRSLEAQKEAATDPAIKAVLEIEIGLLDQRIRQQADLNRQLEEQRRLRANDDELADLSDQLDLAGAAVRVRDRELAQRREIRRISASGGDPNSDVNRRLVEQAAAIADASNQVRQQTALWDELGNIGSNAANRIGDALTQVTVNGEARAIRWGNVFRGAIASAGADLAKLAFINPVVSLVMGSDPRRPSLFDAAGGGGGLGQMLGLGQLFGGKSLLESVGLTGQGGLLSGLMSTSLIAPTAPAISSGALLAAGEPGLALAGIPGATTATGGLSLGGFLGGAGAGFGAGMLLNSVLGGNQTGGMVGSGMGAAAGAIIGSLVPGVGTLIGGLIGGAAGGGLGGLFGPGESVRGYGFRLQSSGYDEATGAGMGGSLLPISRQFYNESGAAAFKQADDLVAGVNAYLSARGLQVGGASVVGGNKDGADYANADAGSLGEAFTRLRFASADDPRLTAALAGRSFDDPAKLQAYVEGFFQILDLNTTPAEKLNKTLEEIGKQFDTMAAQARDYGLAEDGVTAARERATQAARDAALGSGAGLLRELTFGAGSALAPEQQYFAALSTLNTARRDLDGGGTVDAFATVARDVLPVAKNFLGTSERYASLVAEVASAVTSRGGDPAGLGALLQAQVEGTDSLRDTFARYGEKQVDVASQTLAELRRLASTLEALIARRAA